MKEKVWEIILIVLSITAVVIVGMAMFIDSKYKMPTDCERIINNNNDKEYIPVPKYCKKGEQDGM